MGYMKGVPRKNNEGKKRRTSEEVKKLLNRIKMLKREKHKAHSKEKKKIFENRILETEKDIKFKQKKKHESERHAIECMKVNPRMFYSIVNKQKNRKNKVGPFKENGEIIDEGEAH